MNAKTDIKSRLPGRHVTEAPDRAPHRFRLCAMGLTTAHQPRVGAAETFKKTPCAAGLKPGSRYVAKDIYEARDRPLLMETLRGRPWTDARQVGLAVKSAVTHPGGTDEKQGHADI